MINIDVKIGDTILTGKFKNKAVIVKDIGTDEHGMPTINGKKVVTFRIKKKEQIGENKMSNHEDVVKSIIEKTNSQTPKNPKIYKLTWANGQNNVVSMNEAVETINRWANQTGWEWIRVVNIKTNKQQIVYESSNHIGKKLNELAV